MGFFFRKSARLGPFRINFSKSGIGVSAGIPGFRVGTGPRGAYVQAGMGGLYYRQSLGGGSARSPRHRAASLDAIPASPHPSERSPNVPSDEITLGREEIIASGSVLEMRDGSSADLFHALAECRSRLAYAPWVLGGGGLLVIWGLSAHNWFLGVAGAFALPFAYWAHAKDVERKGFVLQYELDDGATKAASALVGVCEKIGGVSKTSYMNSTRAVLDAKYHAGANAVVKLNATRMMIKDPPYLRTNIPVPAVNVGKETLYFLPDRLLVYSGNNVGAVAYRDLRIAVMQTKFIESSRSSVPGDAEVIGRTWRYVNKGGGPDRRFKDNPELPICRYEEIHLGSATGLRDILQLSKCGFGDELVNAVAALNRATANGKVLAHEAPREGEVPAVQPI